jgi:hypothetical protein
MNEIGHQREEYDQAEERAERDHPPRDFTGQARELWRTVRRQLRRKVTAERVSASGYRLRLEGSALAIHNLQIAMQHEALLDHRVRDDYVWSHQSQTAIDAYGTDDPSDIYRAGLLEAAAEYERAPETQTPMQDWLFLDALTYAELSAYKESVASGAFIKNPSWAWQFARRDPRKALRIKVVAFTVRWIIIPAVLVALQWNPVLVGWALYLGVRLLQGVYRVWANTKAEKLLIAMRRAYAQCTPPTISPSELRTAVHAARDAGVVYDGALFVLIDRVCREYPNGLQPDA